MYPQYNNKMIKDSNNNNKNGWAEGNQGETDPGKLFVLLFF
jgi:hypothetical protein